MPSSHQVVQQLFSDEWEVGTFEGMKTMTETYADYFRDLHGWLSEFFFAKLSRACFEKSVKVRQRRRTRQKKDKDTRIKTKLTNDNGEKHARCTIPA